MKFAGLNIFSMVNGKVLLMSLKKPMYDFIGTMTMLYTVYVCKTVKCVAEIVLVPFLTHIQKVYGVNYIYVEIC